MILVARVHAYLIANGVPVEGVSIGHEHDRSTWTVSPLSLQAEAQPLLDAFVIPTDEQLADEAADRAVNRQELRAAIQGLYECIPAPLLTKVQLRARIKEIYKSLS